LPNIAGKLRKLARIAEELREGNDFPVTRLTILKRLCQSPDAANRFVVHLAKHTQRKMMSESCPIHLDIERWSQYKALVRTAVHQMESYLEDQTNQKAASLERLLKKAQEAQNKYRSMKWGAARIIESEELLLVEKALRCILFPHESVYWGYQVAKGYAERYDPDYFHGLIPESASMVEDIADFWCRYYFGMPLSQWLRMRKRDRKRNNAES